MRWNWNWACPLTADGGKELGYVDHELLWQSWIDRDKHLWVVKDLPDASLQRQTKQERQTVNSSPRTYVHTFFHCPTSTHCQTVHGYTCGTTVHNTICICNHWELHQKGQYKPTYHTRAIYICMYTHTYIYIYIYIYIHTYVWVRWSNVSILAMLWPDLVSNDYNAVMW